MAEGMRRVASPDSPNRCQGNNAHGQCMMEKVEGSDYCRMHGGALVEVRQKKQDLYNLRLNKYKQQLSMLTSSASILSLRDEIGVARLTLQELINGFEGDTDLIIAMPQINALVNTIGKLVKECHNIEQKTGQLLDKAALIQFAGKVIDIVQEHVADDDAKRNIAGAIVVAAQELGADD